MAFIAGVPQSAARVAYTDAVATVALPALPSPPVLQSTWYLNLDLDLQSGRMHTESLECIELKVLLLIWQPVIVSADAFSSGLPDACVAAAPGRALQYLLIYYALAEGLRRRRL